MKSYLVLGFCILSITSSPILQLTPERAAQLRDMFAKAQDNNGVKRQPTSSVSPPLSKLPSHSKPTAPRPLVKPPVDISKPATTQKASTSKPTAQTKSK